MQSKNDDQLMKFRVTQDKLKMEINLRDLVKLFEDSPDNYGGDGEHVRIKRGRRRDFAECIVRHLKDDADYERDCFRWSEPFIDIFNLITESDEDFCHYEEEDL